jgi:hypothetical protein
LIFGLVWINRAQLRESLEKKKGERKTTKTGLVVECLLQKEKRKGRK